MLENQPGAPRFPAPLYAPDTTGGAAQNPGKAENQTLGALNVFERAGLINPKNPLLTFLPGHLRNVEHLGARAIQRLNDVITSQQEGGQARETVHPKILDAIADELNQADLGNMMYLYAETVVQDANPQNPRAAIEQLQKLNQLAYGVININLVVLALREKGLASERLLHDIGSLNITPEKINLLAEQLLGTRAIIIGLRTIAEAAEHTNSDLGAAIRESDVVNFYDGMRRKTLDRASQISGVTDQVALLRQIQSQSHPGEARQKIEELLARMSPEVATRVITELDTLPPMQSYSAATLEDEMTMPIIALGRNISQEQTIILPTQPRSTGQQPPRSLGIRKLLEEQREKTEE